MFEETLIQLGLNKNEAKVYLVLLKLGTATAIEISQKSNVHRVNVYDILDKLRSKGLISTIMQSKKRIYEAASPQRLKNIIKEKEEILDKSLPSLLLEFNLKKEKQEVHHFFGIDGVMQAYQMMLDQKDEIVAFVGSGFNRKYLKHRHIVWNKERLRRKITGRVLYYECYREDKLKDLKKDKTIKIRFVPDKFKTPCMVDICGNLVINLLPIEGNIMAIVIENKTLADSYKQFFEFMWVNANR
tara:strand:- start:478 stop:1206 length:729 start_codon:yes stop_codon:yes gene_type:complete